MNIVLKEARVYNPSSKYHDQVVNIHIQDGIIQSIGQEIAESSQVIDLSGAFVSMGWMDLRANYCDPGLEYKEDLKSGRHLAAASGFTHVCLLPNTEPVIQDKNDIAYLVRENDHFPTKLHAIAAITKDACGEEFTEILDLYQAGAVAFSDGEKPIWNSDILLKALMYLQKFDGLLMNRPEDRTMTQFGSMHEGINSTILGLNGMPGVAEELMIERDLRLLEYAGGKIHFSTISSAGSVDLIKKAKARGLQVTCDVAACQLIFDEWSVGDFDTNFKVNPPLRTKRDREALLEGVRNGVIDAIVSNHSPQDEENKKLEFDLAAFGMSSQQTVLSMLGKELPMDTWLEKITVAPRRVLAMEIPEFEKGKVADLTIFDPSRVWSFSQLTNISKSENHPWLGQALYGQVLGIVNQSQYYFEPSLSQT